MHRFIVNGNIRDVLAGTASGLLTYVVSIYALGYTSAFAMPAWMVFTPAWMSWALWQAVVVFGLGATLVALLVHGSMLRMFAVNGVLSVAAFAATVILAMALTGNLASGSHALLAWLAGAVLAWFTRRKLWPGTASARTLRRDPA